MLHFHGWSEVARIVGAYGYEESLSATNNDCRHSYVLCYELPLFAGKIPLTRQKKQKKIRDVCSNILIVDTSLHIYTETVKEIFQLNQFQWNQFYALIGYNTSN